MLMLHRGPIKWRSSLRNTICDVLQSKKDWQASVTSPIHAVRDDNTDEC